MSVFRNSKKEKYLKPFGEKASIDLESDTLAQRCKFNFSYFEIQDNSQSFESLTQIQLSALLNKLKEFSKESLSYWRQQNTLQIYNTFPKISKLTQPKHVPHQAIWACFRLEKAVRLVGFVLPASYDGNLHSTCKFRFDCNAFYVVFFDKNHQFYPMDITNNSN